MTDAQPADDAALVQTYLDHVRVEKRLAERREKSFGLG